MQFVFQVYVQLVVLKHCSYLPSVIVCVCTSCNHTHFIHFLNTISHSCVEMPVASPTHGGRGASLGYGATAPFVSIWDINDRTVGSTKVHWKQEYCDLYVCI